MLSRRECGLLGLGLLLLGGPVQAAEREPQAVVTLRWLAAQLMQGGDARALAGRLGEAQSESTLPADRILLRIEPRKQELRLLELIYAKIDQLPQIFRPEMLGVTYAADQAPTVGAMKALAGKAYTWRRFPDGRIPSVAVAFRVGGALVEVDLLNEGTWLAQDPATAALPVMVLRIYTPEGAAQQGLGGVGPAK